MIAIAPVTLPAVCGVNPAVNVMLWPADSVTPPLAPVTLIPAPLAVAPETVKLEFPVFVKVIGVVAVEFTFTFPNAMLLGEFVSTFVAVIPVPLSAIEIWLSDAVDVTPTDPITLAAVVGANATVICVLAPAANDSGVVMPLTEKPLPVAVTPEMEIPPAPVFVNCTLCVFRVPTGTLPNCAACGVAVKYPVTVLATPVPVNGNTTVPFAALLINCKVPDGLPAVVGVKLTRNVNLAPARRDSGIVILLTRKALPAKVLPETDTALFPEFVIVT